MRSQGTAALLAGCALLLPSAVQAQAPRSYPIADRLHLVARVPAGWREEVSRRDRSSPPTIVYRGPGGAPFEVRLTAAWVAGAAPTQDDVKGTVLKAAADARPRAVEPLPPVVELLGPEARGYYFKATDRAPKRGEYKYLAQGMLALGEARLLFTVLTNDGQAGVVDAAFGMLRNVRLERERTAGAAAPSAAPGAPDGLRLRALLAAADFAALDAQLAAYQDAYRNGAIGDEQASKAFIALAQLDPDHRPAYDKWVGEKPRSYVARLARGYYLARLGYRARGNRYAKDTSRAEFQAMEGYFKAAWADLEASLALDAKPVLSYGTMIWITQAVGSDATARQLLDAAIARDRKVYTARASYLAGLRPEWGGSIPQMVIVLEGWKRDLDPAQVTRLSRMVEDAKVRAALQPADRLVEQKRYAEAVKLYDESLAKAPSARAFAMRGYAWAHLGEHAKAIEDYDRAMELDPLCCSGTRSNRARSYLHLKAADKAIPDLVAAAEDDDQFAARELASMYAFGKHGVKRDYVAARQWCERAAKQGDGLAMYCMGGILHAGLGVPKDAKGAAKWFQGAAQRNVADAQADLAYMLWQGQGVAQDRPEAIRWWKAAARQGNKRAAGQLDANLSAWDYFIEVTVPGWLEG